MALVKPSHPTKTQNQTHEIHNINFCVIALLSEKMQLFWGKPVDYLI